MTSPVASVPETIDSPPAPQPMSYEDYLTLDWTASLVEWVHGEAIFHIPPLDEHQTLVEMLHLLMGNYVQLLNLGKLRVAPFAMRAAPNGPAREPDLFFLATENMQRLTRRELNGPADLVIEVISDDSVGRDRDEKFYEYQEAGIREYWILDPRPRRKRADFYLLDAHNRYQPVPLDADGTYRSSVLPGFWLRETWLWQPNLNPLAALAEVVGNEALLANLQKPS